MAKTLPMTQVHLSTQCGQGLLERPDVATPSPPQRQCLAAPDLRAHLDTTPPGSPPGLPTPPGVSGSHVPLRPHRNPAFLLSKHLSHCVVTAEMTYAFLLHREPAQALGTEVLSVPTVFRERRTSELHWEVVASLAPVWPLSALPSAASPSS